MRKSPIFLALALAACATAGSAARRSAPPADLERVRADLVARLAEERVRAGLGPVTSDATLDEVARRHSEEMRDARFFSHQSPTTGGPADRVARAGLSSALVLENLGRGLDAEALWRNLSETSEQRLHLAHPQATHAGVGVAVEQGDAGALLVATLVLARLVAEIDVATAPAQVRRIVEDARRARGGTPLTTDPALDEAAGAAARRFFDTPVPTQGQAVAATNAELVRSVRGYASVGSAMAVVRSLDEARELAASIDPAARALGVGVAQGDRPDTGPLTIAVVVTWASR